MNRYRAFAMVQAILCCFEISATSSQAAEDVSPESCIVELTLPPTSTVTIDGRDFGVEREIVFKPLEPNRLYKVQVIARLPNGDEVRRKLYLKAGRRVRAHLSPSRGAGPEAVLQVTSDSIGDACFSPDGKYMLISYAGEVMVLWDVLNSIQLRRYELPEAASNRGSTWGEYLRVRFDDTGESFLAANPKSTTVFDTTTGRIRRAFTWPSSAQFLDPTGQLLYFIRGGDLEIWHVDSGKRFKSASLFKQPVANAELSRDGNRLVACEQDSTVAMVYDAADGRKLFELSGHNVAIRAIQVSPDSRYAITLHFAKSSGSAESGETGDLIVWDLSNGRQLAKHSSPCFPQAHDVAFIDAGKQFCVRDAEKRSVVMHSIVSDGLINGQALQGALATVLEDRHFKLFADRSGLRLGIDDDSGLRVVDTVSGRIVGTFANAAIPLEDCWVSRTGDGFALKHDDSLALINTESGEINHFTPPKYSDSLMASSDLRHALTSDESSDEVTLWDVPSKAAIGHFRNDAYDIESFFSPDGKSFVTVESDGYKKPSHLKLWKVDATTPLPLLTLSSSEEVEGCSFSQDGQIFAARIRPESYQSDEKPRTIFWNLATNQPYRTIEGLSELLEFSPDSRTVLSTADFRPGLWDIEQGRQSVTFDLPGATASLMLFYPKMGGIQCVDVSPVTNLVIGGSNDGDFILWDALTDEIVLRWREAFRPTAVAFSPDGRYVATAGYDRNVMIRHADTGQVARTIRVPRGVVFSLAFSPDGRQIVTGGGFTYPNTPDRSAGDIAIWDVATGRTVRQFESSSKWISCVAYSRDGKSIVTHWENNFLMVYDVARGQAIRRLEGHKNPIWSVALSNDGTLVAAGAGDGGIIVWEMNTGRRVYSLSDQNGIITGVRFHPTNQELISGATDGTVAVWDLQSAQVKDRILSHRGAVNDIAVASDGKTFVSASADGALSSWDSTSHKRIQILAAHFGWVNCGAFDSQGACVATGGNDGRVIVWDRDGGIVRSFDAHSQSVESVRFSPDGNLLVTVSDDGTAGLWDLLSGEELARISILGNDWVVTTPDGFFDGSAGGRAKMMFRVGDKLDVVPVDRFFQDFYKPGLLAQIWRGERPLPAADFAKQAAPQVAVVSPADGASVESDEAVIKVRVTDQGGGVKGPWLVHNGARVAAPGDSTVDGKVIEQTFHVALIEGENRFEIRAASGDGSWEAEPARLTLRLARPAAKPAVHVVAIGVSDYARGSMSLDYASADAKAVAELFAQRGPALYGGESVHVTTVLDAEATTDGIRQAIEAMAKRANPQDTVVVFLAGHGITIGQRYYFIPHEFKQQAERFEDDVRRDGLAVDILNDWLARAPALKRVLILDTCQSGGAVALLGGGGRDPFAFRGALERLSHATGTFTIAAAPANDQAQESAQLRHGVLTYALLAGLGAVEDGPLANQALTPGGGAKVAEVREWFSYAQDKVPLLTKLYFGQEQFVAFSGQGTSFPVLPIGK